MLSLPWNRQRSSSLKGEKATPSSNLIQQDRSSTGNQPILSTERRDELLQLARNKRISWVEGNGVGRKRRSSVSKHPPLHVMELMKCADDMMHFINTLEIPGQYSPTQIEDDNGLRPISILEEIEAQHKPCNEIPSLRMDPTFQRAFSQLLDVLKHAEAADLVHSIQGFVKSFHESTRSKSMSKETYGNKVHLFITHFMHLMQLSPLVKKLEKEKYLDDLRDHDMRRETLEAFLMEKLHQFVFLSNVKEDESLAQRIASLSFLGFHHLDITATSDGTKWTSIQSQLRNLSRYLSPRRQMACIMQVCQELTNLLRDHLGKYPGADDFLPALIYTILKANPPHLHSTVNYIQSFRHTSKLMSEPGYFFTHVVSSLSFLEHLDDSGLSITAEEFHLGLEESKRQLSTTVPIPTVQTPTPPFHEDIATEHETYHEPLPSVMDIRNRRRKKSGPLFTFHLPTMLPSATTTMHTFMQKSSEDLRVQEVPKLLAEYKLLNVMCVQHGLLQPKNI